MNKFLFIASINNSNIPRGGAEAKNQILLPKLMSLFNNNITFIDTSKKGLIIFYNFLFFIFGLIFYKKIILSIASTGLEKIAYLNFILKHKDVYIFVIGGVVDQKLINKRLLTLFENAKIVYAETNSLVSKIKHKSSKINVEYLPNFKPLPNFDFYEKTINDKEIKFVYLSRVNREKGIFRSIELVKYLNQIKFNHTFHLDIYGPIDLSEQDREIFFDLIDDVFISYKGVLDLSIPNNYYELSKNHFFIFLTTHPGEGFPGVLIDALCAKNLIIASDWAYNEEIVPQSNLVVDLRDDDYFKQIYEYVKNILLLDKESYDYMLKKQSSTALQYDVTNIDIKF